MTEMTRQEAVGKAIARSEAKDMEFFVYHDWELGMSDENYSVISQAALEETIGVDVKEDEIVCMVYAGEVCEVYD
jgi:hypothetical protein